MPYTDPPLTLQLKVAQMHHLELVFGATGVKYLLPMGYV